MASIVLALGGALTLTSLPAAADTSFSDVPGSHVFVEEIEFLASTGITTGYDNGNGTSSFRPSAPVLREQMAAFLYRLDALYYGEPFEFTPPNVSPFTDVPTTHVFYKEIVWLAGTGITTGYDNGNGTRSFQPSAPVLREQMAAFLCRFDTAEDCSDLEEYLGEDPFQIFTDVFPNHVFFDAIFLIGASGVSTGYDNGDGTRSYRPGQPVLREQMAAFLTRYIGLWDTASTAKSSPAPAPQALNVD